MSSSVTLPEQLPVMPLPGAVLFPHALLPLYIFEPRYRKMLEHALQRDRMFSVDADQAESVRNGRRRRIFSISQPRIDSRLCRTRRRHFEFGPARSASRPFHQFRTGNAVSQSPASTPSNRRIQRPSKPKRLGQKCSSFIDNLKHDGRQLPAKGRSVSRRVAAIWKCLPISSLRRS